MDQLKLEVLGTCYFTYLGNKPQLDFELTKLLNDYNNGVALGSLKIAQVPHFYMSINTESQTVVATFSSHNYS